MIRQVVLDTETTGLEPELGHRIIEIGCVELQNRRRTGRRLHHYVCPDREIDPGALEVHGITSEFLADQPRFAAVADDLLAFIDGAELVIHNAAFDVAFLDAELARLPGGAGRIADRCRLLDTLMLARQLHPGQRNSLDALCKRYHVDNSKRDLHGALLDAELLLDVYLAMTGGQGTLILGADDAAERAAGAVVQRATRPTGELRVLRASAVEVAAHEALLERLDRASGGRTLSASRVDRVGPNTLAEAFARNFLGRAPGWYKLTIVAFLIANPVLLQLFGPIVTGWALLAEFIFTLAMALRCYPLQPGGLLALQAMMLGLTTPESVYAEIQQAFPVILLLIFMVAGIYFLRDLLMFIFTRLVLRVRSQTLLALVFCATSAVLSAFLDALTVVAVAMMVGLGFYQVYHRVASGKRLDAIHDETQDTDVRELHRADLEGLRGFLRGLMMHAAVGTALGGVTTMVGEPQNLLIAEQAGWDFRQFFLEVAPVSLPVLAAGLLTCVLVQHFRLFGYGEPLPAAVRRVLEDYDAQQSATLSASKRQVLIVQAVVAVLLVLGLAFHLAAVGVVGLFVIVLATAFTGVIEEHRLGKAFETALPFTALLVVFFVIVAEIHDQHLFEGLIRSVLALDGRLQSAMMYAANGVLSAISDNVFVATIYITEIKAALLQGAITREQFDALAVAVNTGTNIPSVATPNGQAAFLFLLTSTLAPLIRLGYLRMVWMALPYTVVMTTVGLLAVVYLL